MASSRRSLKDPGQVARARQRMTRRSARPSLNRVQTALCDPVRLSIVQALSVGSLSVGDLAVAIDRTPAATSQHLRVLRRVGVVEGERCGTTVAYRLRPGPITGHVVAVLQALEASTPASS